MNVAIRRLVRADWPAVAAIYSEGIATRADVRIVGWRAAATAPSGHLGGGSS